MVVKQKKLNLYSGLSSTTVRSVSDNKDDFPPVKRQVRQQNPRAIVQVNNWLVNQDGEVELVAALLQENFLLKHPQC